MARLWSETYRLEVGEAETGDGIDVDLQYDRDERVTERIDDEDWGLIEGA